tara:strand:+ start:742 stop:891 length:150 start_codon:yes stop_codon:yes gene_type:complete
LATYTIYIKHPIYTNAIKKKSSEHLNMDIYIGKVKGNRVELRGIEPLTS